MRVRYVTNSVTRYGELVGLVQDKHDVVHAVLRLDGHGLMLTVTHPSSVTPDITPLKEEERLA